MKQGIEEKREKRIMEAKFPEMGWKRKIQDGIDS